MTSTDSLRLMFEIFCHLGCFPTVNDDDSISVQYQGENFHMEFKGSYVRIWDMSWININIDDPDLPKIQKAVNIANFKFGPIAIMTNPDDEGIIGLHIRWDLRLHSAYPDNVQIVRDTLNYFFETQKNLINIIVNFTPTVSDF